MTEDDFEPARRELCPDGTCIGLVGPDGRCKVCGTVSASVVSDPRHRGLRSPRAYEGSGDQSSDALSSFFDVELDDDRELCPDGTCIGIIGPDGRCKVCGAKGTGTPRVSEAGPRPSPVVAYEFVSEADSDSGSDSDADDEDRQLCPDGSCIGLIGPDGKCKVCGTQAPSADP